MTAREELAADAGFKDGFDGKKKFFSFKPLSDKESVEYTDQYQAGLAAKKEQVSLASRQ